MLLRRVNGNRKDDFKDPDIKSRKDVLGNTSFYVGSFQKDELCTHSHSYFGAHSGVKGGTNNFFTNGHHSAANGGIANAGGNETRQKMLQFIGLSK